MIPLLLSTFITLVPANTPYPKVLDCIVQHESGGKQFDKSGNPLISSTHDVGVGQINLKTWLQVAKNQGLDIINSEKDNIEFTIWLYNTEGPKIWATYKYCHGSA